jgi:signal transduction histidine kinase
MHLELARYRLELEALVRERTVALGEALFASQSAERVKDALLRNATHELRTPLNHIMGGADLLLRGSHDEKQDKWLKAIHASSREMLRLGNELLDVARLEAGEIKLETREFSPAAVLEQVRVTLLPLAEKKGIAVQAEAGHDLPPRVIGDPTRLAQALLNYVDNAIKFTEKGSVTLSARTVLRGSQAVQLHFEVSDTGIGIAPEEQDKLFSAFTQLDATTTRRYGGMGIGLSNVAELAKLMGGKVGVSSTPGKGSTFWLMAPFQLASPLRTSW